VDRFTKAPDQLPQGCPKREHFEQILWSRC